MKRYLLFTGIKFYPCGGMCDFAGDYDTKEEAMQVFEREPGMTGYQWAHVYDTLYRAIRCVYDWRTDSFIDFKQEDL